MQLYDTGQVRRPHGPGIATVAAALVLTLPAGAAGQILFEESPDVGIDFVHTSGRSENRYVPEMMGSGAAWIDYDRDGHHDLYLVDSGALPGMEPLAPLRPGAGTNRLYRGRSGRVFEPVSASGLEDRGFGMGVAAADYDNDGWIDVYVSNFREDALYRNNGDGTFEDVSALLPPDDRWSASVAWGDLDVDGWPDLYVTHYLRYPLDSVPLCTNLDKGVRQYCPPQRLDGDADRLLRNLEGSGFQDITTAAGVENAQDGKGLGVVITHLNDDGLPDIYVANDTTQNFMYVNQGEMRFVDEGLLAGTGLNDYGQPQSGMGVDIGDLDGNGFYEIAVTNFVLEPVNLYSRGPAGLYLDSSYVWGVGEPTLNTVGFGISFLDADGDGDLDFAVANGHVLDDHPFWAQPNQVFRNERSEMLAAGQSGATHRFTDITDTAGPAFPLLEVSRGMAVADADADGRPELVVTNSDGPARVLWNHGDPESGRLVVRLRGREGNRDALGATLHFAAGEGHPGIRGRTTVVAGSSYLSQDSTDVYLGLGDAPSVELEITWPDGSVETFDGVAPEQLLLVREGQGVVGRRPLEER